jgi:hypothetical protein
MSDQCPRWAEELIARIRAIELQLGNIVPEGGKDWHVSNVEDLYRRTGTMDDGGEADEGAVEALFAKVARGLAGEGLKPSEIAALINARVPSGGRLPYCSAAEVAAVL